ncbi:hypothetical protein [Variovorax sp.]|uniref:hypothetical protein n=1 Tax=Variovorax sp. TaxID=1871043 RepID=UPI003BA8BCAD
MRNRLSLWHWTSLFLLNLAFCFLAGKDYNWDLLNYHFYGPSLLLDNRWSQDYFAGSIQSYLNPIAYVPFYLMVKWGWSALIIGLILSTINFLNIIVVGSIAKKLFSERVDDSRVLIYMTCLLAMAAPAYLQANGSSFNDPYGSVFILIAVRVLLSSKFSSWQQAAWVGFFTGAATGIKLTSATFAVAFMACFIARALFDRRASWRELPAQVALFVAGATTAFVILHGFWSFKLLQEFGSPVFPFFNAVFKAPEFQFVNNRDFRFLGSGLSGLLFLPFDMLRTQSWIYSEAVSPDLRPSILMMLAAAAASLSLWRAYRSIGIRSKNSVNGASMEFSSQHVWTPATTLVFFAIVAFLIWGVTSRIGRYAFSLWLLVGPLLGLAALKVGGLKFARITLGVVLALQTYIQFFHGSYRWSPVAWEESWLDFKLPSAITQQPAGIISTDTLSFSAIVPSLHPDSGMATISGMHTMENGSEMPSRLTSLVQKYNSNLYVLYAIGQFGVEKKIEISRARLRILDEKLAPYGLELKSKSPESACEYGRLPFNRKVHSWSPEPDIEEGFAFAFCKIEKTSEARRLDAAEKSRLHDRLFEVLEDACPEVFAPKRVVTIHHNDEYIRSYFNTASGLYTDHGSMYLTGYRVLFPTYIGRLEEILQLVKKDDFKCPSLPAHRYLD